MSFILKQTSYHYLDPLLAPALAAHGLDQFQALWNREIAWFEEPNQRRGGWSGVGRLVLQREGAEPLVLFVKKQLNYGRRTWRHPWRGEPTFRREFYHLRQLTATGVSVPRVVAYAEAMQSGQRCAVLVTENLHEFIDLETLLPTMQQWPRTEKIGTLRQLARQIRRFHDLGLVHRALYPKHLFVRGKSEQLEVALIDLEKTRSSLYVFSRMLLDLTALQKHTPLLSRSLRLLFFKCYLGLDSAGKLSWFERWCLTRIMRRSRR